MNNIQDDYVLCNNEKNVIIENFDYEKNDDIVLIKNNIKLKKMNNSNNKVNSVTKENIKLNNLIDEVDYLMNDNKTNKKKSSKDLKFLNHFDF